MRETYFGYQQLKLRLVEKTFSAWLEGGKKAMEKQNRTPLLKLIIIVVWTITLHAAVFPVAMGSGLSDEQNILLEGEIIDQFVCPMGIWSGFKTDMDLGFVVQGTVTFTGSTDIQTLTIDAMHGSNVGCEYSVNLKEAGIYTVTEELKLTIETNSLLLSSYFDSMAWERKFEWKYENNNVGEKLYRLSSSIKDVDIQLSSEHLESSLKDQDTITIIVISEIPDNKVVEYTIEYYAELGKETSITDVDIQPNHPPILGPISDSEVIIGQELKIFLSATDSDEGDVLTYSASGEPMEMGAQLNGNVFFWLPGEDIQVGDYSVTFTVGDGDGESDEKNAKISVIGQEDDYRDDNEKTEDGQYEEGGGPNTHINLKLDDDAVKFRGGIPSFSVDSVETVFQLLRDLELEGEFNEISYTLKIEITDLLIEDGDMSGTLLLNGYLSSGDIEIVESNLECAFELERKGDKYRLEVDGKGQLFEEVDIKVIGDVTDDGMVNAPVVHVDIRYGEEVLEVIDIIPFETIISAFDLSDFPKEIVLPPGTFAGIQYSLILLLSEPSTKIAENKNKTQIKSDTNVEISLVINGIQLEDSIKCNLDLKLMDEKFLLKINGNGSVLKMSLMIDAKIEDDNTITSPKLKVRLLYKPEGLPRDSISPEDDEFEEETEEDEEKPRDKSKNIEKSLEATRGKLANFLQDIEATGVELDQEELDNINVLLETAQTALEEEKFDEAEELAKEAKSLLEALKEEVGAKKEIKDAEEELAELLEDSDSLEIELPEDKLNEFEALLEQAKKSLEEELFEEAEVLANQGKNLLDTIREEIEGLEKTAEEIAEDVRKAAKDVNQAARAAFEAAQEMEKTSGEEAADVLQRAIKEAKKAAKEAEKVMQKAEDAAKKADKEKTRKSQQAALEAEDTAAEAISDALIASEKVVEAAEILAENTQKVAEKAKEALETDDLEARRAAEAALAAAEKAAKQVAEAAELVNENGKRAAENAAKAAEKATEKAKDTADTQDELKAQETAKAAEKAAEEAARAAQDAAEKAASAAAVAAENAALTAETDALEADETASEAARQPVREAQKLARETTRAFKKAAEKAEKAAKEAQIAAEKAAQAADEASRLAAEKAKQATEKAKQAAEKAEQAAKRASKEATDLYDDGKNDIFDLIFVAKFFGQYFASSEEEGAISDINGDSIVDIKDLVLTARGLTDGVPIPAGEKEATAAPSRNANANVWLKINQRKSDAFSNTLQIDLMADCMQELYAFQFELSFEPDILEVVEIEKGSLLDSDGSATYWRLPRIDAKAGTIIAACTRIASESVSETGVLATVTFNVNGDGWQSVNPLKTVILRISDARGDIVENKLIANGLDFRKALMPRSTKLLQNYPNPFNPETWIPYQLAQDAVVTISIYDIQGRLVRKLNLGRKLAGVYITKERASYWNGRNNAGEKVSSGIYFYQLQADDYSATKRMLILK